MCTGAPIQSHCEPNLKKSESEKMAWQPEGRMKRNESCGAWQAAE
jgi:hypothetical protein